MPAAPFFLEETTMPQHHTFEAEVVFLRVDVARAVQALAAVNCAVDINLDDDEPDYAFASIHGVSELGSEDALVDWLSGIVEPLGGDIDTWCICELRDQRQTGGRRY
jgi:hypothetical protein